MNVQLGTAVAAPGSRATGWLAVETAPGEQTKIPVVVINGGQPGPRLAITAGSLGGEYTGPAAMRSLLLSQEAGDPAVLANLKGSIIATLATSPAAFTARSIYVNPQDGKNLNRVYPGSATGSASERIAHTIATQLMTGADVYLDLHAGDINEALSPFVGIDQTGDAARQTHRGCRSRRAARRWRWWCPGSRRSGAIRRQPHDRAPPHAHRVQRRPSVQSPRTARA
ncbi:MAG: succinylglutamate desuccinylase/aspartoacylase family protein, partial [Candidatus Limnocylindrus sp.]